MRASGRGANSEGFKRLKGKPMNPPISLERLKETEAPANAMNQKRRWRIIFTAYHAGEEPFESARWPRQLKSE